MSRLVRRSELSMRAIGDVDLDSYEVDPDKIANLLQTQHDLTSAYQSRTHRVKLDALNGQLDRVKKALEIEEERYKGRQERLRARKAGYAKWRD